MLRTKKKEKVKVKKETVRMEKKFGRDKKIDQGLMMKIGAILLGTL